MDKKQLFTLLCGHVHLKQDSGWKWKYFAYFLFVALSKMSAFPSVSNRKRGGCSCKQEQGEAQSHCSELWGAVRAGWLNLGELDFGPTEVRLVLPRPGET